MRRQYSRPRASATQYALQRPRVQNRGACRGIQNPTINAAANPANITIGRTLTAERPANIRREVEEKRRELQEKYCQEAAEAEEKRLRREQKKKEEWLKRQESLVRPGHRLGYGTQSSNLQRDLVEHQEAIGIHPQENSPYQQQADEQFRMLVQQRMERDTEGEELNRKIEHLGREAYERQRRQALQNEMRREFSNSPHSRNTPRNLGASTSNTASSSTSNTRDSANPRKQANLMNATQNASSSSNKRNSANLKKPDNFLGVYRNVSPLASNTNARRPVNFLGVADNASPSTSNTNGPASSRKPVNFLGVAQNTSPSTTNTNVSPASAMKPANFLGTVQVASPSSTNTNGAHQAMSGQILGSGASQTEVDNRERMRAARLRMQAQYNEEVKKAEQAKDQEEHNLAEGVERISLN